MPLKLTPSRWTKKNLTIMVICAIGILLSVCIRTRLARNGAGHFSEPIQKGSIIESVYGIGTVTATKSFQLKMGVTSTIQKIYVKEGDQVQFGQKLIDLDGPNTFTAPFAGTITFLPFKVGENVFAQSVILSLVDLSERYIVVSLEQRGVLKVHDGQKARISFDSMRDQVFSGNVESVYSNDNNFLVRIGVSDLPAQVLPGMSVDVAIGISERSNVLLIPVAAIDAGKVTVQHAEESLKTVTVKTGVIDGAMAEMISGDLAVGDRLLIKDKVAP